MTIYSKLKKKIINSLIDNNIKICFPIVIQKNKNEKNGHYQLNNLFQISSQCKINHIILAKKIIKKIKSKKMIKNINFSKPCFINILLNPIWIEKKLEKNFKEKIISFKKKNKKVVIDYSSPNVAKSMHVGHLRSTIIGDSTARIMEFTGYNVIRVNHIGDWGNQFGVLIAYLKKKKKTIKNISIKEIEKIYQKAKKTELIDKKFSKKAEIYTAKLQKNEKYYNNIWKKIVNLTIKENNKIYKLLNITLKNKNICGESFYKKMVKKIEKDLLKRKIAVVKKGNTIVFLKKFKNRKGKKMGVVLKKKSGSFLYSIIDIACMKYRYKKLKADIILYYIDSRQKEYLKQIYEISKIAGYIPKTLKIKHHFFGMMLSKNNRPFQTRSGKTIKLKHLIVESIKKAKKIILKKNKKISKREVSILSKKIGIGALKYSDLSKNRKTNYIFCWKKMISFEGNTSLYIQYTYIRIFSILKKYGKNIFNLKNNIIISNNHELLLAIEILQFKDTILQAAKKGTPHLICKYIYNLASKYSKFYEKYVILNKKKKIRDSRLKISFLVSKILKRGLNILGIKTIKSI